MCATATCSDLKRRTKEIGQRHGALYGAKCPNGIYCCTDFPAPGAGKRFRSMLVATLMKGLAANCPIFLSEAQFQHALALHVRDAMPGRHVCLEFPPFPKERMSLDLWIPDTGIAIELKYGTRKLKVERDGGVFELVDQGRHPQLRYDFVKDIQRLEHVTGEYDPADAGFAVLLTNDPSFWKPPPKKDPVDAEFRIHEGAVVEGKMEWSGTATSGTKEGREDPIELNGSYECRWRDYLRLEGKYGQFRYLAIKVPTDSAT